MSHGKGNILANIRECHMEAEHLLGAVLDELTGIGFSGILDVGAPPNVPPARGGPGEPAVRGRGDGRGGHKRDGGLWRDRAAGRDPGAQRAD